MPASPIFDGLETCDDVRPAMWLELALEPWGPAGRLGLASLVPRGFDAYARLLHPAYDVARATEVRWSEIARARGRSLTPTTQFAPLAGWDPVRDEQDPRATWSAPDTGSLTRAGCAALAEVLARHTTTPDRCWFCLWEGYGWANLPAPATGPPRVRFQHRDCLLFTGPVRAATAFVSGPWFQSPTWWWPDDHAWVVATELDIFSTYVAATSACVAELLTDPRFEALPSTPDDRVDAGAYGRDDEETS